MSDNHERPFSDTFRGVAATVTERYDEESDGWTFTDAPSVPERLEEIIEICFSASLKHEEHNPTALTVVLGDEEYFCHRAYTRFAAGTPRSWDYASFSKPIPMTPAALCKLAAGLDFEGGAVLAWCEPSGPCLYGIVRFSKNGTSDAPHREVDFIPHKALRITMRAAGSLVFDDLNRPLAELNDLRLTQYRSHSLPNLLTTHRPWSPWTLELLSQAREEVADFDLLFNLRGGTPMATECDVLEIYKFCITEMLGAARRHRRGGTFVFAPTRDLESLSEKRLVCFDGRSSKPDSSNGVGFVFVRLIHYYRNFAAFHRRRNDEDAVPSLGTTGAAMHSAFADLRHACRYVGGLSACDGAVLVNPALEVLAIGAKLPTKQVGKPRLVKKVADGRFTTLDYSLPRGSRFGSAVATVQTVGATVVLISSDGPVALLFRNDDECLIYEPCTLATRVQNARA